MKSPCDFYDSTIYRNCPGTAATQNLGTLVPERSCVIKIEGDKYVEILLLDRQEFKKKKHLKEINQIIEVSIHLIELEKTLD